MWKWNYSTILLFHSTLNLSLLSKVEFLFIRLWHIYIILHVWWVLMQHTQVSTDTSLTVFWNYACFHGNIIQKSKSSTLDEYHRICPWCWGETAFSVCGVISGQWIRAWGRVWQIAPPAGGALRCATPSLDPPAGRTWSWPDFLLGDRGSKITSLRF